MKIGDVLLALFVGIQTKMDDVKKWSKSKMGDEEGATAVEYVLVCAVVTVGVVGAASAMYEPLGKFFAEIVNGISAFATKKLMS